MDRKPTHIDWKRYMDDVFSIIPKGKRDTILLYLNSINPHIKFTIEQPNEEGALGTLSPNPKVRELQSQYIGNPHTWIGTWILTPVTLSWPKEHRAENVCSDPDILAKEMEHLNRVLHYNNYPQWMTDKWGKSDKHNPIIHSKTGVEIQKCFYISVPYFPGLSESYKKIFKYTPIQVSFKGVNFHISANASQRQNLH